MNLDETRTLASRRDICYNNHMSPQISTIMYDDYDLDYELLYDHADLEEYADLDEDYARDDHDYQDLAYRHYA